MLPFQRKKIDISVSSSLPASPVALIPPAGFQKLSPQEQQLFSKYGKVPTHKNIVLKVRGVHASETTRRVSYTNVPPNRNVNISILVTTPCPRLVVRRPPSSELLYLTLRST